MTNREAEMNAAIAAHINPPAWVYAWASAVRYDLLYGPSFSAVPTAGVEGFTIDHFATLREDLEDIPGATITETYTGPVGEALASYIEGLPSELWYDNDSDDIAMTEPTGDDMYGEWRRLSRRDIVKALFGRSIAEEFK